jgi:excisionase family DNA binding protein
MDDQDWLSVNEAANFLGVSRRTMYNWINAQKVAVKSTPSGRKRVSKASLLRDLPKDDAE